MAASALGIALSVTRAGTWRPSVVASQDWGLYALGGHGYTGLSTVIRYRPGDHHWTYGPPARAGDPAAPARPHSAHLPSHPPGTPFLSVKRNPVAVASSAGQPASHLM